MKRVRWKSKYSVGIPTTDEHNKELVILLNGLVEKSSQLEHCKDLSDLQNHIGKLTGSMLQEQQVDTVKFRDILATELPLKARNTPACHNCDLCDHLGEQITDWLDKGTIKE